MAFFFFFFNDEKRIGFKKLSRADLGISDSSNQTHIGLYEGVLEFLDDTDVVKSAMLIYDDYRALNSDMVVNGSPCGPIIKNNDYWL